MFNKKDLPAREDFCFKLSRNGDYVHAQKYCKLLVVRVSVNTKFSTYVQTFNCLQDVRCLTPGQDLSDLIT